MDEIKHVATILDLDVPSLLSVEYPLLIKNTDKAISMIGGKEKLQKCFIEPDMKLELRLRSKDINSHPIHSNVLKNSKNLLIKFRIPKRILIKFNNNIRESIEYCEENKIKYFIEPFGILKQNYKFRELADFQRINKESKFNEKFNKSILIGNLENIKEFSKELDKNLNELQKFEDGDLDIPSLIRYSRTNVSHNYKYFGKLLLDEHGEWLDKSVKLYTIQIKLGEKIPINYDSRLNGDLEKAYKEIDDLKDNGISDRLIKESPVYHLIECLKILKKLFDMKPIWIRRHIYWLLPKEFRSQLRFALPFVSFIYANGPWRHSFIKLGYDPSKDKESYKYQIEAFRGEKNSKNNQDEEIERIIETEGNDNFMIPPTLYDYIEEFSNPESELNKFNIGKIPKQLFFDGKNPCYSIAFQIGDIMDEDILKLLENIKIEPICNEETGWFDAITLWRIKNVIKYKLKCMKDGVIINEDKVQEIMTRSLKPKEEREEGDDKGKDEYEDADEEEEEDEEEDEDGNNDENEGENENDDENNDKEYEKIKGKNNGIYAEENIANDDILKRLEKLNPKSANIINEIDKIIKQENIMNETLIKPGE
jgi:general transcription factor 3C polypeptide 5 (transcription factor C subunit 1)